MGATQIGRLPSPIIAMANAASASTDLFAAVDAKVPDTTGMTALEVQSSADIVFENVSFTYPSRPDVQILNEFNGIFTAGKVTAIVGPSGSGKSTIVGLIERWYDVGSSANKDAHDAVEEKNKKEPGLLNDCNNGGIIKVGDIKLTDIETKWWRSQIGLVQQEPFLFNDTIFHNVAFGLCGTIWEEATEKEKLEMVKQACKEAYADEFISSLPKGYDTIVGESGIKLSGGQRQRIAIARSIVKRPAVLILDEATSAIDVRTERIVQQALDHISQNRTTIVIAHRLSTIKRAHKIIVLRQGRSVEEGTHEQLLLKEDGVYRGLVNAQTLIMGKDELSEDDQLNTNLISVPSNTNVTEFDKVPVKDAIKEADSQPTYGNQGFFTSVGRLIYEQKLHWLLYSLVILAAMGGGAVFPLQAWIFAKLINVFSMAGSELVHSGNFWALMFFIQAIGAGIVYFILGYCTHLMSVIISTFYRIEYMQHFLEKRISFFDAEGNGAGTLTSRLSNDPQRIEGLLNIDTSMGLIAIFNIIGSIIISFIFGWKLSLVGVLATVPIIIAAGYLRYNLEMQFEEMNSAVFAESSQFGSEAIGAFRTITSLIMEDFVCNRYARLLRGHVMSATKKAVLSTVVFAFSDSIDLLCTALVFWYGATLLASHQYSVTQYFVIYMAVIQGSQAAGLWFSFSPNMAEATAASNRIISIRPLKDDNSYTLKPFETGKSNIGIEFKDVNFTYESRNIPVLSGMNLKINPGQFVGLVGASGSGKSTIISLLERFYDTSSGVIICGDQNIADVNTKDYRKNLSLVPQESTLYQGSIRENVALSVDEAEVTEEAVEQACRDAQIHDFIASLPEGYATRLGPKAVQLSGGQRQRLALARAFLRQPKLLLLDEATSSLDSESEKLVQQAIERVAGERGRTIVAVAHRLATVQNADVIYVIGGGRVVEHGSHQELLKQKGLYYQMVKNP
jgi:ATP-binding cassette, subfamily B (MDR/TAP), member 1